MENHIERCGSVDTSLLLIVLVVFLSGTLVSAAYMLGRKHAYNETTAELPPYWKEK